MKLSLYSNENEEKLFSTDSLTHISMFQKYEINFHFSNEEDLIPLIKVLLIEDVLFKAQGSILTLIPEQTHSGELYQKVCYRFDESH